MSKLNQALNEKAIAVKGLTEEEHNEIKTALKDELSFRVSVRRQKQKYAYGAITILPYGKGVYRFTDAEVIELADFLDRHEIVFNTTRAKEELYPLLFNVGFSYCRKLA